jgi:hypothetical protein
MTLRNNSGEVPAGHPRAVRYGAGVLAAAMLGLGIAACGGGDSEGAVVSVYVGASLCKAAKGELAAHGASAGHFKVAARCLAPSERAGGGVDLAANGSNSRRATSDTSAIATLESPGPGNKFSRSILESAGIPLLTSSSGRQAMKSVIEAVENAGSSGVRSKVQETLEPS